MPFRDNPTGIDLTTKPPVSQAPFKATEPSNIELIPMTKTYNVFGAKFTQTTYVPAPSKSNPAGIDLTPKAPVSQVPFRDNPTGIDLTPKASNFDSGAKPNFPAPVIQHNSNNLQNNHTFAKTDLPHCDREFSFFKILSDGYRCFGASIETKITIGPNSIKAIGPDIIGRKAAACFGVATEVAKAIQDPCLNKHLEYQGKIDPYFVAMPMHNVIDAVKYSVEMGGENSGQ